MRHPAPVEKRTQYRHSPFDALEQFPPAVADGLRRMSVTRRWRDGETVLYAGRPAGSAVLLLQGQLRIAATSAGGEEVLFRWFVPGEFVGLASVLGNTPSPVSAVAVGACVTVHFERERMMALLRTDAEAVLTVAQLVSRHVCEMQTLVVAQACDSLTSRVLSTLTRIASHNATRAADDGLVLNVSQQDIAHAVGASRQRVNLELRKLEQMGRIRIGYRNVVLVEGGS